MTVYCGFETGLRRMEMDAMQSNDRKKSNE